MSAGTITLTNNSAAVSGAGTAFTTDLKAGDIIASVVGGVTYTLPVKTVNSAASVTLIKNYDGPTQSGAAWYAIPRDAMNAITAQLAAETAQALRGLNYDKQNWQLVFSSNGNITVRLPDGSTFSGPSWSSIVSALNEKADKSALGTAAAKNTNTTDWIFGEGNVVTVGNLGFGEFTSPVTKPSVAYNGFYKTLENYRHGICFKWDKSEQEGWQFARATGASVTGEKHPQWRSIFGSFTSPWYTMYSQANTTIDSNGFIKQASPVVRLYHDGTYKTNDESEGANVKRESVGVYRISGVLGMHSDGAWGGIDGGFEIPTDRNGQRLLWLDYKVEADGSILVKTYHRTYPDAPAFARNIKEGYEEGDPIDIPSDQFVSVRVEMPQDSIWNLAQKAAQEEMEQEKTTEE